jgi:hypothetical protein
MTTWKNHRPHARDQVLRALDSERELFVNILSEPSDPDRCYYAEMVDVLSAAIVLLEEAGNDR